MDSRKAPFALWPLTPRISSSICTYAGHGWTILYIISEELLYWPS
jgi:hypothetical protein